MRKSMTILAVFGLLALSVPAFAHFTGHWDGSGSGGAIPMPSSTLSPWETWGGDISADHSTFQGTWNGTITIGGLPGPTIGYFKGSLTGMTSDWAEYKGYWYWKDKPGKTMGEFRMSFYWANGVCYGEWHSYDPAGFSGTMWGDRW